MKIPLISIVFDFKKTIININCGSEIGTYILVKGIRMFILVMYCNSARAESRCVYRNLGRKNKHKK